MMRRRDERHRTRLRFGHLYHARVSDCLTFVARRSPISGNFIVVPLYRTTCIDQYFVPCRPEALDQHNADFESQGNVRSLRKGGKDEVHIESRPTSALAACACRARSRKSNSNLTGQLIELRQRASKVSGTLCMKLWCPVQRNFETATDLDTASY